jgi:hypothetical protein
MSREAHIPLALWVCAAILAHMGGGEGAVEVAKTIDDRAQLRAVAHAMRDGLRHADTVFEVLTEDTPATPSEPSSEPPDKDSAASDPAAADAKDEPKPDPAKPDPKKQAKAELEKKPVPVPEPKKEEPHLDPALKPAEKPKPPVVAKAEQAQPAPPAPPPPPPADHRIAVRQHVDPDQEDNPTANRIADDANHVKEETVARIRSHDQDDPNPTPGSQRTPGPRGEVGDSDHDKLAQSEDKKGDPTHGPGEKAEKSTTAEHHNPVAARPTPPATPNAPAAGAAGPGRMAQAPGPRSPATAARAAAPPPVAGGAGPTSPEAIDAAKGGYTLDPANPGGDGRSRIAGRRRPPAPYQSPVSVRAHGLNAPGIAGGPNINLTMAGVEQAVGYDKLKQERAADGEARRSAHRGSFDTNKFERWRAAIENYEPTVKTGNQTALNAARVPFATYINTIHNRIHPIFAEEFLASLDNLPPSHALNKDLVTHLEIVLNKDEGRIVRMGVTRASGVTAFDIVALNSVSRASPFGKAPDAIVSPDGNVYLHWEFHRDPFDACTTRNARPFLLKSAPTLSPAAPPPRRAAPPPSAEGRAGGAPGPLLPLRQ